MNRDLPAATNFNPRGQFLDMWRVVLSAVVFLALADAAHAADIDTCRNGQAEVTARLAACEAVIADDAAPAKSRASAYWYRGDQLVKKRDYDGAITAFNTALAADPDNVVTLNSRGIAYSSKGDNEHALADFERCLQLRPKFASPYNNRGLIYLRTGDVKRALDDFNAAVQNASTGDIGYIHY